MDGVARGYLVQAHTHTTDHTPCTEDLQLWVDVLAAFLVGAGEFSYFGSGLWISADLADVERRWCRSLFERPLGPPRANASRAGSVWTREFASGTIVTFDSRLGKGDIAWGGGAPEYVEV